MIEKAPIFFDPHKDFEDLENSSKVFSVTPP